MKDSIDAEFEEVASALLKSMSGLDTLASLGVPLTYEPSTDPKDLHLLGLFRDWSNGSREQPFVQLIRERRLIGKMRTQVLELVGDLRPYDADGALIPEGGWIKKKGKKPAPRLISYIWPGGQLRINMGNVQLYGLPEDPLVQQLATVLLVPHPLRKGPRIKPTPTVGFLVDAGMGLQVLTRPLAGDVRLQKGNYHPEVVERFPALVELLDWKQAPMGRLAILSGPPGTGKTWLIKAICNEIKSHRITPLMLSPDVAATLGTPKFLAWLLQVAMETNLPICIIIEDADHLILRRDENPHGLSALSNFLQVTSGMLGEAVDLRIVCTINEWDESRIDPAVIRPGRLHAHVRVPLLSPIQATATARRLGSSKVYSTEVALAQVYADSKE